VGVGPLQADLRDDLGVSRAAVGVLTALPLIGMGVFALTAAPLSARVGTRRAFGFALWLILAASLARSVAPGYATVVAATLLFALGQGLGNALPPMVVKERLADTTTRATATYATGLQVGAALAATFAVPLASVFGGWRGALAVLALLPGVAAVSWPLLVHHAPAAGAALRGPRGAPQGTPRRLRLRLATLFACMSFAYYGTIAWLAADLSDTGWSAGYAGVALGVLSVTSIGFTILYGAVGDRFGSRTGWWAMALGGMAVGILGVLALPAAGLFWAACFGAGNGAGFGAAMTLPLDLVADPASVVALTGPMLLGGYVLAAASPPFVGLLRDVSGSFVPGFLVLAGLCVLGIVMTFSPALRPRAVASDAAALSRTPASP
jgi:MFS transporter, CP family, cyanate transporter